MTLLMDCAEQADVTQEAPNLRHMIWLVTLVTT